MLTLRWRDYPRSQRFVHHRARVALLYPNAKPTAQTGTGPKSTVSAKQRKSNASDHAGHLQALPKDWQEIDVDHLVLAKQDGPWPGWWEAIAIETAGDVLKLRWRDYAKLPIITRPRFELALICPEATESM